MKSPASANILLVRPPSEGIDYLDNPTVQEFFMIRAIYQPQFRFDPRAEREECDRLYQHSARVLQDRLVRRSHTDRTRQHAIPEWEKLYQSEAQQRLLLHQARVLSWGKEKRQYFAHKNKLAA
jgi:hypothetical protein